MNPLGVLCARDVMEAATGTPTQNVGPEDTIQSVMEIVQTTGNPVGVMADGVLLGQVTSDTVLARLLHPNSSTN